MLEKFIDYVFRSWLIVIEIPLNPFNWSFLPKILYKPKNHYFHIMWLFIWISIQADYDRKAAKAAIKKSKLIKKGVITCKP